MTLVSVFPSHSLMITQKVGFVYLSLMISQRGGIHTETELDSCVRVCLLLLFPTFVYRKSEQYFFSRVSLLKSDTVIRSNSNFRTKFYF